MAGHEIIEGCGRKIGPFNCCSIVQGDCLELMKQLPDGCVDAVISDTMRHGESTGGEREAQHGCGDYLGESSNGNHTYVSRTVLVTGTTGDTLRSRAVSHLQDSQEARDCGEVSRSERCGERSLQGWKPEHVVPETTQEESVQSLRLEREATDSPSGRQPLQRRTLESGSAVLSVSQPTSQARMVVVTDPPFGIADAPIRGYSDSNGRRTISPTGNVKPRPGRCNTWHPPSEWDKELNPSWLPIALKVGPVALFGQWRKRTAFEVAAGMEPRSEIIWAKDTHVGPPCPVAPRDERIWVFAVESIRTTRFETSVWDEPIIPTWEHKWHKNEKPEALMSRLVSWLDYDTILDPFCGSGTTLVAAKKLGRHYLGFEISPEYCEIARKRIALVEAQPSLFEKPPEQLRLAEETE